MVQYRPPVPEAPEPGTAATQTFTFAEAVATQTAPVLPQQAAASQTEAQGPVTDAAVQANVAQVTNVQTVSRGSQLLRAPGSPRPPAARAHLACPRLRARSKRTHYQ